MNKNTLFKYNYMVFTRKTFRFKDTHELKVKKNGKKTYHAKRAGVSILRSDKLEFKTELLETTKGIYDEKSVNPSEIITITNIYAANKQSQNT